MAKNENRDEKLRQNDLADRLAKVAYRLRFLADCFSQSPTDPFRMSHEGQEGIFYILDGAADEIKKVAGELG